MNKGMMVISNFFWTVLVVIDMFVLPPFRFLFLCIVAPIAFLSFGIKQFRELHFWNAVKYGLDEYI